MNRPMPHVSDRDTLSTALLASDPPLDRLDRIATVEAAAIERRTNEQEARVADQTEADIVAQTVRERMQQGRRRADAVLMVLRAMVDAGRPWTEITSDDGNCIWLAEATATRVAGKSEHPRPVDNPKAEGAQASTRVLGKSVEDGVAAMDALRERMERET